jgi:adenine/guanine/hypoxanthine permease
MKVGWFVRGDIDGFFGLFVDNLLQLMLIAVLCGNVARRHSPGGKQR